MVPPGQVRIVRTDSPIPPSIDDEPGNHAYHVKGSLGERNSKRHRAATVSLTLDDWEHAKQEPSERALDLDLLRGTVELEVLYQFRNEGLHLYHPNKLSIERRHRRPGQ